MRPRRQLAALAFGLAVVVAVGGCGGSPHPTRPGTTRPNTTRPNTTRPNTTPSPTGPSTPVETYFPDAVGFGESLDRLGGAQRVLSMYDPAPSAPLHPARGQHAVSLLVETCASTSGALTVTDDGWSLVTTPPTTKKIVPAIRPQPASEGSPPIADDGRIGAGKCAMADLYFVVPDGTVVLGAHFVGKGSKTGTWIKIG